MMRERKIEKDAKKFAVKNGWYVRKFKTVNRRGVPDDIFIRAGVVMFIEFKKPGEPATEQQHLEHERIRAQGIQVHVVDSLQVAQMLLW